MLTQVSKTGKSQKQVFILCRYLFKTNGKLNGTVCSQVRTSEGKEHKVWTHTNGCASSCDCEGFEKSHGRKCFHIKHVEAIEAARKAEKAAQLLETVNAALSKVQAEPATAEELAATQAKSLLPNVDQVVYFIQLNRRSAEYAKQQQLEAESKRRTSALLNNNQGFSLLKKAS